MQRDRRSSDNWALIYDQSVALEKKEKDGDKRKKLPGELAQELNLVDPIIDD